MKTLERVVGLLALVIVSAQSLRHVYVCWVEPRGSVLDRLDDTRQDIAASKSLDELIPLYLAASKKVKEADAKRPDDSAGEDDWARIKREPYKSELQLKSAILEWENHRTQMYDLHYFWWAGAISISLGALGYWFSRRWLGFSALILGYVEMIWATVPSFSTIGRPVEFERLLTFKVVYSVITLALVLIAWFAIERQSGKSNTVEGA